MRSREWLGASMIMVLAACNRPRPPTSSLEVIRQFTEAAAADDHDRALGLMAPAIRDTYATMHSTQPSHHWRAFVTNPAECAQRALQEGLRPAPIADPVIDGTRYDAVEAFAVPCGETTSSGHTTPLESTLTAVRDGEQWWIGGVSILEGAVLKLDFPPPKAVRSAT